MRQGGLDAEHMCDVEKKSYSAIEHSVHRVGGRPYNLEVQEVIQTLELLAPDPFRIMLSKGGFLWKL